MAWVKAFANRVLLLLLLGLGWIDRSCLLWRGGKGVLLGDGVLELVAVDRAVSSCCRLICLVKRFSSWNLKRCWPEPTHGIFRRRHRPQVGCFSSHYFRCVKFSKRST